MGLFTWLSNLFIPKCGNCGSNEWLNAAYVGMEDKRPAHCDRCWGTNEDAQKLNKTLKELDETAKNKRK